MILLLLCSLLQQFVGEGKERKERRKSVREKDGMTKSWEREKEERRRKKDVLRITEWKKEKGVRVERIRAKGKKELEQKGRKN